MKTQHQGLLDFQTEADVFEWIKKVIASPFEVAVWKLPESNLLTVLVDITGIGQSSDLEDLQESFIINSYNQSHPPRPHVLRGDLVVYLSNGKPSLKIHPSVSSTQLEHFASEVSKHPQSTASNGKPTSYQGDFQEKVVQAKALIAQGEVHKIVLSRYEDHALGEDFDVLELFERLVHKYPNAFCHLTSTKYGLWIGASPELLIAIDNNQYFGTDALAGTQAMNEDDELSDVAWTQKEIEEQAMVSRYIIDCFKQIRLREFDELGPKTVKAGNLAHLKTTFRVDMESTNSPGLGTTMLELLHPTSAVCGYPRDPANQFISTHEGYDRELYAGFLGPVGFDGNTRLYVNLRCMKVMDNNARLYAGAGIIEDSNPKKEMNETSIKLQTLLSVLHS